MSKFPERKEAYHEFLHFFRYWTKEFCEEKNRDITVRDLFDLADEFMDGTFKKRKSDE